MRRFVVIVEQAEDNFSAYSPDLPGCVATGSILEETMDNMVQAIILHLKGLEEDKESPSPSRAVSTQLVYACS